MTEILTESFCERCGTRYTFESARPRVRLKGVKVLSRGLKNFVLSDETTMDEAMASARNETDREVTAHQLDAFHKTFNFCMSCRQYTCPNCWNEVEARCLTCAPHLGHEILQAPFPDLAAPGLLSMEPGAVHANGVNGTNGADGSKGSVTDVWPMETAATDVAMSESTLDDIDAVARLELLNGGAQTIDPEPTVEAEAAVEAEPPVEVATLAAADPEADPESMARLAALVAGPAVADAAKPTEPNLRLSIGEKTAAQTGGLFRRFRPGQDLAEELDAYERGQAGTARPHDAPANDVVAPVPEVVAESEVVAEAAIEPSTEHEILAEAGVVAEAEIHADAEVVAQAEVPAEPEIYAEAGAAAEPPAATVEPDVLAAPEIVAAPEVVAVEREVAPEPAGTPVHDVVPQPLWRMVAPDPTPAAPAAPDRSIPAAATRADPAAEPQWPTRPAWLGRAPSTGLPFLDRTVAAQGGIDALWAESANEVVASPAVPGKPAPGGVQPCISCGLSLSGNARFCRRCGTPQAT